MTHEHIHNLRDPSESEQTTIGSEDAEFCDGLICGTYHEDDGGEPVKQDPHLHLTLYGLHPATSGRRFRIKSYGFRGTNARLYV